jgi:hypothetical protein
MNILERPIKDLEAAKCYFQAMGCSHFHMFREYPDRYNEYKVLNISSEMEFEWRQDSLEALAASFRDKPPKDFWWIHSRMDELVRSLKTPEAVSVIYECTVGMKDKLPPTGKLLVAETINGRQEIKYKPGLIFLSYKLGEVVIAKDFATMALEFAQSAKKRLRTDMKRCEEAAMQTQATIQALQL